MEMLDTKFVVSLVGDLGAIGFVFWMVVRLTNHTIPRLAGQFIKASGEQRLDFKTMMEQQRADFLAAIDRQEKSHKEETSVLIDGFRDLKSDVRSVLGR